jgi:hypothetical protein
MAVSDKAINFIQGSLERGRPIPGQSLTNSPDQPYRWEQPSEFTSPKEAMLHVFEVLTVPEAVSNIIYSLSEGVGVVDLASITLYSGFIEGKWNPDLMVMLMEPTMYMIMALAEKADIEYDLESGDRSAIKKMSSDDEINKIKQGLNELDKLKQQTVSKVNAQVLPKEIREMVEETELPPSLLERVKKEPEESLLNKEA